MKILFIYEIYIFFHRILIINIIMLNRLKHCYYANDKVILLNNLKKKKLAQRSKRIVGHTVPLFESNARELNLNNISL